MSKSKAKATKIRNRTCQGESLSEIYNSHGTYTNATFFFHLLSARTLRKTLHVEIGTAATHRKNSGMVRSPASPTCLGLAARSVEKGKSVGDGNAGMVGSYDLSEVVLAKRMGRMLHKL